MLAFGVETTFSLGGSASRDECHGLRLRMGAALELGVAGGGALGAMLCYGLGAATTQVHVQQLICKRCKPGPARQRPPGPAARDGDHER